MTVIVTNTTTSRKTVSWSGLSIGLSARPRTLMIHIDTNAPTMNTSPWAKLMSSMIP